MPGKDYYKTLGVSRSVTPEELKKAYKKLALKWHPDRCPPEKKDEAQAKFQEIGEAFDVLSDPEKKRIYDQVGEEGLRGGVPSDGEGMGGMPGGFHFAPGSGGGMPGGFHFSAGRAEDIFREMFGGADFHAGGGDGGGMGGFPFMMGGMGGGMPGGMPGGMGGAQRRPRAEHQAPAVHQTLYVTLEDLFTGVTKKMRITKKVLDASGASIPVASEKEIQVKQGWKDGTKITFPKEGDELPGVIPADIVFTLQTRPHERFVRDGDDLIYTCPVQLADALSGVRTSVMSLDNRRLAIEAPFVTPDTVKIIPGEGMPNTKKRTRGDLKVQFKVIFPTLSDSERRQVAEILRNASTRK